MGTDGPIFFIGFNKCGTLSLHHHLLKCGLRSFHGGSSDRHFDEVILVNISYSDQPLYGVPPYDAWSDSVPVQREFRYFDFHYPTARFVLNTRDVLRWVVSRLNHLDGNYVTFMNLTYRRELAWQEWADEWRCEFLAHECAVTAHFAGRANFLYFNIETDPVGKLNEFLRLAGAADSLPHENVAPRRWYSLEGATITGPDGSQWVAPQKAADLDLRYSAAPNPIARKSNVLVHSDGRSTYRQD
jgi:hypothetical protein